MRFLATPISCSEHQSHVADIILSIYYTKRYQEDVGMFKKTW